MIRKLLDSLKIAVLSLFLAVQNPSIVANVSFSVDGILLREAKKVQSIAHPHKLFMVVFISVAASITMMLINMMVM